MNTPTAAKATAADRDATTARRIRVLSHLVQLGPEPSLRLSRHLAGERDLELRTQAAVLLARHPVARVSNDLANLLSDPAAIVQRRAVEGLIRSGTAAPPEQLLFRKMRALNAR